jgi:hypothetical protein
MKTLQSLALIFIAACPTAAPAADAPPGGGGCMMMKKEPAPPGCCCCAKMQSKPDAAKATDIETLIEQMKTAKGDQLLDSLAAVLNKLIEERKAGQPAAGASGHQH